MVRWLIVIILVLLIVFRIDWKVGSQKQRLTNLKTPNWFDVWRRDLQTHIRYWLPGDTGALASGILLGGSTDLERDTYEAFKRIGLLHIVAASGYNLILVASAISKVLETRLGKRVAIWGTLTGIWIYVGLAGAELSIIRAGIMASLAQIGLLLGRPTDSRWLLIVTALTMLLFNPNYLFDIGFQLSFAATAGILWFRPQQDWAATLAAQGATAPILLYHFGQISLVSPLVNVALLWLVPIIMIIVAWGLLIGPVNYLAWPLLKIMIGTVKWADSLPTSALWVLLYYLVAILLWWMYAYLSSYWRRTHPDHTPDRPVAVA